MRNYSDSAIIKALPYSLLTREMPNLLQARVEVPQRHVHTLHQPGEPDSSLLMMPAWGKAGGMGGVKIVNVTPGNSARHLPCVAASYLLFDEQTGIHKALLDGGELTARRTAAVAAIAADRLTSPGAKRLLLVGSGRIASELAFAYQSIRAIEKVDVFSPTRTHADKLVRRLQAEGFKAVVCQDLEAGVREADIVACATLSTSPLIHGDWLCEGQHLALIGGYLPDMREADDAAIQKCQIWIDTHAAMSESGDLVGPLSHGIIHFEDICGTLADLCARPPASGDAKAITLFKSVGDAAQDLAAATLAVGKA